MGLRGSRGQEAYSQMAETIPDCRGLSETLQSGNFLTALPAMGSNLLRVKNTLAYDAKLKPGRELDASVSSRLKSMKLLMGSQELGRLRSSRPLDEPMETLIN